MFWIHVLSILLAGGLMLLFVGAMAGWTIIACIGLISFVTALLILFYGFKEADY